MSPFPRARLPSDSSSRIDRPAATVFTRKVRLSDLDFNFESEFSLLDIGATSSFLRSGSVRPTILAFAQRGVESVALCWDCNNSIERAFEEARRYVRDQDPAAYAAILHASLNGGELAYHQPDDELPAVNEYLMVGLYAQEGDARVVSYPIRRNHDPGRPVSMGMPVVTDSDSAEWRPLGELWANPFCAGDTVRFRARDRAVDPSTPLWHTIVDLTRMRIQDDPSGADEYMAFLDDLRNSIFAVVGRQPKYPSRVILKPRTQFNPLGTIAVEAVRLVLGDTPEPDVETAG
jgi:hypothetical protein